MDRCLAGGMTYTRLASTLVHLRTCRTGMVVERWSTSARMESYSGERCMMTTKAMPQSGAIAPKNSCKAASPPAEPPKPTTGSLEKPSVGTMFSISSPLACSTVSGLSAGKPWSSGASIGEAGGGGGEWIRSSECVGNDGGCKLETYAFGVRVASQRLARIPGAKQPACQGDGSVHLRLEAGQALLGLVVVVELAFGGVMGHRPVEPQPEGVAVKASSDTHWSSPL